MLHVNQESRKEALQRFTLRLSTEDSEGQHWIDPTRDSIYFPWVRNGTYGFLDGSIKMKEGVMSQILTLAVDIDVIGMLATLGSEKYTHYLRTLSKLNNLVYFYTVLHSPKCIEDDYRVTSGNDLSFREPKWDFVYEREEDIYETIEKVRDIAGLDYEVPEIFWVSLNRWGFDCCYTEEEEEDMDAEDEMECYRELMNELGSNPYGYDCGSDDDFEDYCSDGEDGDEE